jgi:NAD(P)-dependent dehydrogenase (short-subunit alcohol dehydrogenase family)
MRGRIIAAASPPILVTGAIGALAAAILSRRGFQVTASAGGAEEVDDLKKRERERDRRIARGPPDPRNHW